MLTILLYKVLLDSESHTILSMKKLQNEEVQIV